MTVSRLTKHSAARVAAVGLRQPLAEAEWAAIRAALDEHSVLVFHGQAVDDDAQVAFSRRFGALEVTRSMNPVAGTPFARQSNLDIETGEVIPAEDRQMIHQFANMLWHSYRSFKPVPSLCSLLSGRIVLPGVGSSPAHGRRIPRCRRSSSSIPSMRLSCATSRGHATRSSRGHYREGAPRVSAGAPPARAGESGQRTIFLGAHASHVEGLLIEEGRAVLKQLLDHVTQPEFCYRHEWTVGDLVIWDNRCVLHTVLYVRRRMNPKSYRSAWRPDKGRRLYFPGNGRLVV
jgi:alpha-ketoglutarate-dependent 2,4-dichlorophenoxyacetate dioxygenase